jgi:hypothetical protein
MSKIKTNKKSTVTIEWPTSHFTIDDVQGKYPEIVNITLRFRVKKAIENKEIVAIGRIKPAIGRPKLVFSRVNPSKEVLDMAKSAGVIFIPGAEMKTEKKNKPAMVPIEQNTPATT